MQSETVKISIDDEILLKKCRNGDSSAMEMLILKYQNRIFNAIYRICGNFEDAAELTQDTFVKVIENIDKFEERSGFYTWAFRIATNLTLNYCHRASKLAFVSLDSELDESHVQSKVRLKELLKAGDASNPMVAAQDKEISRMVQLGLMKLDDSHRAVIVLRDIEGMNYNQIADVLGIELGTVKSRISRARGSLKEILEAISK